MSSNDQCNFIPEVNFPNGRKAGKRLDGFAVLNVTDGTPVKCFAKCTEHCQCKSVNVCGKTCQLNSGKEEGAVLTDSSDCTYFEVSWIQRNSYGVRKAIQNSVYKIFKQGRYQCIQHPCFARIL